METSPLSGEVWWGRRSHTVVAQEKCMSFFWSEIHNRFATQRTDCCTLDLKLGSMSDVFFERLIHTVALQSGSTVVEL